MCFSDEQQRVLGMAELDQNSDDPELGQSQLSLLFTNDKTS